MNSPRLTVVAPCFNEEEVLPEFYRRVSAACRTEVGESYELVLVDDGSNDTTWNQIADYAKNDQNVVGLRLFRNHGHQLAVTAGLSVARGDRILLIDADLQDPPELLAKMMTAMDAGADVVYGLREARGGETAFKLVTASIFYRLLNALSRVPIPKDTGDFRLMRRQIVETLKSMPEQHRFIRGMVSWIGGTQVALPYVREARFAGTTKYPLKKMIAFAIDAITSFSTAPLRLAVWLGLLSASVSFLVLGYAVFQWAKGNVVPGWASSLVATALFSGVQLVVLGVIGEYLGRVMEEVKKRPLFVIGSLLKNGKNYSIPTNFCQLDAAQQRNVLDLTEHSSNE
jgi:polyisoprenyl-phosphate glycosyltransferase